MGFSKKLQTICNSLMDRVWAEFEETKDLSQVLKNEILALKQEIDKDLDSKELSGFCSLKTDMPLSVFLMSCQMTGFLFVGDPIENILHISAIGRWLEDHQEVSSDFKMTKQEFLFLAECDYVFADMNYEKEYPEIDAAAKYEIFALAKRAKIEASRICERVLRQNKEILSQLFETEILKETDNKEKKAAYLYFFIKKETRGIQAGINAILFLHEELKKEEKINVNEN